MSDVAGTLFYGNAVLCHGKAVLIQGPSGRGKSDLTLRYLWEFAADLFDQVEVGQTIAAQKKITSSRQYGFISDDQVVLKADTTQLIASPPKPIAGLCEVRGLGIISMPYCVEAPVSLIIDIEQDSPPRFIEEAQRSQSLLGFDIPVIGLNPFEISAPLKITLAQRLYGL